MDGEPTLTIWRQFGVESFAFTCMYICIYMTLCSPEWTHEIQRPMSDLPPGNLLPGPEHRDLEAGMYYVMWAVKGH